MSNYEHDYILSLYKKATEFCEHLAMVISSPNNISDKMKLEYFQYYILQLDAIINKENEDNKEFSAEFFSPLLLLREQFSDLMQCKEVLVANIGSTKNDSQKQECDDIMKSVQVHPRVNGFDDIAGLVDIKKTLKTKIMLSMAQPQLFSGQKICNSILLYGPPGTGKTRIVHAIAAEATARLYSVTWSDILSKYIGETEKLIRSLFNTIKSVQNSPAILFIDEIDGLCRQRTTNEEEWIRRLKTELLHQMSNFEDHPNIFLICATNCPWDLDSAFFRRFQQHIYIPLPNRPDRFELFKLFTKTTALESTSNLWEPLLKVTEGFSGSDISNAVCNALNIPIMELTDCQTWCKVGDKYTPASNDHHVPVENITYCDIWKLPAQSVEARSAQFADLFLAVQTVKRTVTDADLVKYERFVSYL